MAAHNTQHEWPDSPEPPVGVIRSDDAEVLPEGDDVALAIVDDGVMAAVVDPAPPNAPQRPSRRERRRPSPGIDAAAVEPFEVSRRWLPIRVLVVLVSIAALVGLATNAYQPAGAVIGGFLLLTPVERLFKRHSYPIRRPGVGQDIRYALLQPLLFAIGVLPLIVFLVPAVVIGTPMRAVVSSSPFWLQAVASVLLGDFLGYWAHRWLHERPRLWRFHRVHHSSPRLDWIAGFRLHPGDVTFAGIVILPQLALGLNGVAIGGAFAVVTALSGAFSHANVRWRLRPLHRVILTPDFHHWHHALAVEAHNANYAGLLPLWDILFGTYHMPTDRRPEAYGIEESIGTTISEHLRSPWEAAAQPRGGWRWLLRRSIGWAWQAVRHPVRCVHGWARTVRTLPG